MSLEEEQSEQIQEKHDEIIVESNGTEPTSTTPISPESVLEEQITLLQAEAKENYDKYLRSIAELENFKKRTAKERSELIKYAGEYLARDLLEVIDNFERALQNPGELTDSQFFSGVKLIAESFIATLERHSIKGESGLGGMFDPSKQEALASVPTPDKEPGTILEEYRKAYFFKDKLLRHGQVVVASSVDDKSS